MRKIASQDLPVEHSRQDHIIGVHLLTFSLDHTIYPGQALTYHRILCRSCHNINIFCHSFNLLVVPERPPIWLRQSWHSQCIDIDYPLSPFLLLPLLD